MCYFDAPLAYVWQPAGHRVRSEELANTNIWVGAKLASNLWLRSVPSDPRLNISYFGNSDRGGLAKISKIENLRFISVVLILDTTLLNHSSKHSARCQWRREAMQKVSAAGPTAITSRECGHSRQCSPQEYLMHKATTSFRRTLWNKPSEC